MGEEIKCPGNPSWHACSHVASWVSSENFAGKSAEACPLQWCPHGGRRRNNGFAFVNLH